MVAIRRADRNDLDRLLGLCVQYCLADGHEFDRERVARAFVPLLDSDRHGAVWAAESTGGALVGYAVVTWGWSIESGGADALLDEIYVSERDQGVGAAMLEAITADCRRHGCSRLFLETERANVAARRFYRRHGFHVEDSIWMSLVLEP